MASAAGHGGLIDVSSLGMSPHAEALPLEVAAYEVEDRGLVVDEEDLGAHGWHNDEGRPW